MNARAIECPYCKAGKGQECRNPNNPREKVLTHPARKADAQGKRKPEHWKAADLPWAAEKVVTRTGVTYRIVTKTGAVVATLKYCDGTAHSNASLIVRAVNPKEAEAAA